MHIAEETQNRNATALCLAGLGSLALTSRDYDRAEQHYRDALKVRQEMAQEPELAVAYCNLGQVLAVSGEPGVYEAWQLFQAALHLALKHGLAPLALHVFTGAARLLAARGEHQRAVDLLMLAAHDPAATAETKRTAQVIHASLATAPSGTDPLPDWQLMAQALVEELAA